jgi:hypothetical protein
MPTTTMTRSSSAATAVAATNAAFLKNLILKGLQKEALALFLVSLKNLLSVLDAYMLKKKIKI